MGVHHAWGRTYKDLYQRFHAMLGDDQRYQNGFDCQGLWVEVNVERDLGFTSKRDIEAYGIAEFVSLCKQRVLTFRRRQTEQSIRLGDLDGLERPGRAAPPARAPRRRPGPGGDDRGPGGSRDGHAEMVVGRLGCPTSRQLPHVQQREHDLVWGFLAECHRRGWIYRGHDTMPWCAALRHRAVARWR